MNTNKRQSNIFSSSIVKQEAVAIAIADSVTMDIIAVWGAWVKTRFSMFRCLPDVSQISNNFYRRTAMELPHKEFSYRINQTLHTEELGLTLEGYRLSVEAALGRPVTVVKLHAGPDKKSGIRECSVRRMSSNGFVHPDPIAPVRDMVIGDPGNHPNLEGLPNANRFWKESYQYTNFGQECLIPEYTDQGLYIPCTKLGNEVKSLIEYKKGLSSGSVAPKDRRLHNRSGFQIPADAFEGIKTNQ